MLRRYAVIVSAASISPFCEFALRFLRTIILSRLLTPVNLGASVALATILTTCEMITDVGLEKYVIVAKGVPSGQVALAARQIAIGRAAVIAVVIVLLAPHLAGLFDATTHLTSIRWLAVVPLFRSLRNWRTLQLQREYRYGPEAIANITAHSGALLVAVLAALWFKDERAMFMSLLTEAILYAAVSHMTAPPERVVAVDPAVRQAALTYGLPLVFNGLGLLVLYYLDRYIVANLFGLEVLALYTLVLGLALAANSPINIIANKVGIPYLVRSLDNPKSSQQAAFIVTWGLLAISTLYAIAVAILLDWLVPLLYGPHYQVPVAFHALATGVAFLRVARCGPDMILASSNQTKGQTIGNLISGVGLLIGWILTVLIRRVEWMVLGVLVGDLLSLAVLLGLVRNYMPLDRVLKHAGLLAVPVMLAICELLFSKLPTLPARALVLVSGVGLVCVNVFVTRQRV
jgi:O-antigen/teichoic acid export membrane protein